MSTAQLVRDHVYVAAVRSFLSAADMPGSRRAVECELSRLVAAGRLLRVRRGLYWKGSQTRIGMPAPRPMEIGLAVAGPGSGPAGFSAAVHLGLSTQIPATETIAVAGRVPSPVSGVRFVSRSIERRIRELAPTEVAVIEVLRDGPDVLEADWESLATRANLLSAQDEIRLRHIAAQMPDEHHVQARSRWHDLNVLAIT